ncbi:hypothetical protein [Dehalogenimonas etheniformans]|uniref:Uncharacterized protein n=1 Tax=Dehalogenimonas etheniformans TaxID=1536648 RepID=A0A2P5P694_9CHLR|nr:hypothetical protein [Dehalogenimonas etheniformans]PPD57807.1 hypothetical protein JP09_008720 [Dehalogenimonas etheniformans]QNT76148.1 hypothetical protein HX448_05295 [Dehalogenimonas etheniformans]
MNDWERVWRAAVHTQVIRPPQQLLATFGQTNIHYYLLTEPAYKEMDESGLPETVLREGRVIAERPKIVTPLYMKKLEGFGDDARRYFDMMMQRHGPNAPGLLYTYKNEPKDTSILSGNLPSVAQRINNDINERGETGATIIRGLDEMWDVSLFKFIYELTEHSIGQNVSELHQHGLMGVDERGLPAESRMRIEQLFWEVGMGECDPATLKTELDRWELFDEYQDRFFEVIRRRR